MHRLDTYLLKRNALSRLCPAVHGTIIKNGHNLFDKGGLGKWAEVGRMRTEEAKKHGIVMEQFFDGVEDEDKV